MMHETAVPFLLGRGLKSASVSVLFNVDELDIAAEVFDVFERGRSLQRSDIPLSYHATLKGCDMWREMEGMYAKMWQPGVVVQDLRMLKVTRQAPPSRAVMWTSAIPRREML